MQVRTFSTKSNALRALKSIMATTTPPANLVRNMGIKKFVVHMDEVQEFMKSVKHTPVSAAAPKPDPISAKAIAPAQSAAAPAPYVTPAMEVVQAVAKAVKVEPSTTVKPYIRAKAIVADLSGQGKSRKEIIAACIAVGITYNTADGAHYQLCVCKK